MNLEQLQSMSDDELNELAAVKVMGWEVSDSKLFYNERFTPNQSVFVKQISQWNPTNDMNDCFKLLNTALENCKYTDATISMPANVVILHRHTEELVIDKEESLTRAITIASILAYVAYEENGEDRTVQEDVEYLLVENKRLRDKLESVEHWLNGNRIDLAKQALKQK